MEGSPIGLRTLCLHVFSDLLAVTHMFPLKSCDGEHGPACYNFVLFV